MNALDRKILETLGWTYSHETNVWFNQMGGWSHEEDPELITTDMLIEAACEVGDWRMVRDTRWKEPPRFGLFWGLSDETIWEPDFRTALRAALAAHWGVSDE